MSSGDIPARDVRPLGNGRFEIVEGSRRRIAYAVRAGARTWVFLDGRAHLVGAAADRGGGRRARSDDDAALAAPMPATVVAVNVDAGQQVAAGDVLITLEAMKMELAIKAPRTGTVRRVACRAGELVQPGTPLVELD